MSTAVHDITSGGNEVELNSKMKITKLYNTENTIMLMNN